MDQCSHSALLFFLPLSSFGRISVLGQYDLCDNYNGSSEYVYCVSCSSPTASI